MKKLVKDIGKLLTMDENLGSVENVAIVISDGKVEWVGNEKEIPKGNYEEVSASNGLVTPGLIDCHTHLVHFGYRQNEFADRARGKTYQEIAAAGGGIMSTVRSTREATFEQIANQSEERLFEAVSFGTSSLEIKTGYGLNVETELKMMNVIELLNDETNINVVGTFLGAHVVPTEFKNNRNDYINIVINEMLPKLSKSPVCKFVDVFVEEGAYSANDAKKISESASKYGLRTKLHVDQFTNVDGAMLAAELNAISADHLDRSTGAGLRKMAERNVVGVILPGASSFVGAKPPDARRMCDLGVNVSVATDYNPGTCPSLNLILMASMAVTQSGLTVEEAWKAITLNASRAIGEDERRGRIAKGMIADLTCFDVSDEAFPFYRYSTNFTSWVMINGIVVHE